MRPARSWCRTTGTMARILVVEDEADIRQILAYNLGQSGHEVLLAERGGHALAMVRESRPDLVLLDLMLPDISGLDVCRSLKSDANLHSIPVIMLTARSEEIDRVVGFELGADDYVVKPFSVRELILRIQAVMRRTQALAAPAEAEGELRFGRLRVDRHAHRVWVDGQAVALTPLEMRLLLTLYERRGRVQSRGTLLDDVWEASPENNTRTVDTHVKRLREKLGPAGAYVETVRGVGYRFADSEEQKG
jgi:two-component system phosphate regulon response regulator PhoB